MNPKDKKCFVLVVNPYYIITYFQSEMNLSLDQLLKIANKEVGEIISHRKINQGEVNQTYILVTEKSKFVLRYKDFDFSYGSDQALISDLLSEKGVKQAKVIYFENNPTEKYCIEIQEFVEGISANIAIEEGELSYEQYYSNVGKLLSVIHSIGWDKFGYLNNSNSNDSNYLIYLLKRIDRHIIEINNYQKDFVIVRKPVIDYITDVIQNLEYEIKPVLIHSDPTPDNVILKRDNEIVLIDWDDARADFWMIDLAWLTFYSDYNDEVYGISSKQQMVLNSFAKGHGGYKISDQEFQIVLKMLHLFLSLQMVDYYMTETQNFKWVEKCKKRLNSILPESLIFVSEEKVK